MLAAPSILGIRHAAGNIVTARLNLPLQPMDRRDLFDDPLDAMLKAERLGAYLGTRPRQGNAGKVHYCDFRIRLPDTGMPCLNRVCDILELIGAPKGSRLLVTGTGAVIPFGRMEGLAIFLNGTDLDEQIYENYGVDHVVRSLDRLMGQAGHYKGSWQGPRETALYFLGRRAEIMRARIDAFLADYPLCRDCRAERIA